MKKNKKTTDSKTLKWIYCVAKPHRASVIFLIILNGISASFGSILALISKDVVDSAQNKVLSKLIAFCVCYGVISLVQIISNIALRYYTEKCRAKLDITFRRRTFKAQLTKKYPQIRAYHSGDLVNRLTGDVGVITDAITTIPSSIASVTIRLVCAFSILVVLQWQFALIFALGGGVVFLISHTLRGIIKTLHSQMQQKDGKMRSFWQETIENLLVVKSFASEEKCVEKSDALVNDHYKTRMKKASFSALSSGANHSIMRFGYIFALVFCAFRLLDNKMSFGTLTAVTSLVGQVQMPFVSMSGIMPRYYAALSSAERLMEIENLQDENKNQGGEKLQKESYKDFCSIDINNVDFGYDESEKVLENASATINKGDFVSIMGQSGIGKSTLFKLLLNIYPQIEGDIVLTFKDKKISVSPDTRSLFAYVPQGNLLFSGTIRENLLFLCDECDDEKINNALKIACADTFLEQTKDGLDTHIGEGGLGLSEGQIQRLALARAILSDAPILLLDEATSALDENTEAKVLSNIKSLTDKTCLIVTHKKAALDICTKHFVIKDGRIET